MLELFGYNPELYFNENSTTERVLFPQNDFYKSMLLLARKVAKSGKGIYMVKRPGGKETSAEYPMLDLASLKVGEKGVQTLLSEVINGFSPTQDLFRYLMVTSACYVEVPRDRFIGGGTKVQSYDKWLCTSSVDVVAAWLGVSLEEAENSLKGKLNRVLDRDHIEDGTLPWVKLEVDKEGSPKIVKSRNLLDLGVPGTRVMPLVVLMEYLNTLIAEAKKGYLRVKYLKDNGQVRVLDTTLNLELLSKVYSDAYSRSLVEESYDGETLNWKSMSRGYVRIPEVGLPELGDGVRALNFNRILSVEKGVEPDLRYVKVDLKQVVPSVTYLMESMGQREAEDILRDMLQEGILDKGYWLKSQSGNDYEWKKDPNIFNILENLSTLENILGTDFQKRLHDWTQSVGGKRLLKGYDVRIRKQNSGSSSVIKDAFTVGILEESTLDLSKQANLPDSSEAVNSISFDLEW